MRKFLAVIGLTGLLLAVTACNPPDNRDADAKALRDLEAQWVKDIATKDVEKFASYYTDDASFLPPSSPAVTGKAAIRDMLKAMLSDPNFSLTFTGTKAEVAKSGDVGWTQGNYTMTISDPVTKQPVTDKGKYITVFRKGSDGAWKASADMISSDGPPPPPK